MKASTRFKCAAAFVFFVPFALASLDEMGVIVALVFVHIAWTFATMISPELALIVLFLSLLQTRPHYDGPSALTEGLAQGFGATVALSVCALRVSPKRMWRAVRSCLAEVSSRLFSPPGARGTIHARWFALGFWLVFVALIAITALSRPSRPSRASFIVCALSAFVAWTLRWFFSRWDPAALARMSLVLCAHPFFYVELSSAEAAFLFSIVLPTVLLIAAAAWALHDVRTDYHLRAGVHPRWIMAEFKDERVILRERVSDEGYRSSTQGRIVGSLPQRRGPGREVIARSMIHNLDWPLSWPIHRAFRVATTLNMPCMSCLPSSRNSQRLDHAFVNPARESCS